MPECKSANPIQARARDPFDVNESSNHVIQPEWYRGVVIGSVVARAESVMHFDDSIVHFNDLIVQFDDSMVHFNESIAQFDDSVQFDDSMV